MLKKILFISSSILAILIICITYLSVYGVKTDSFNNLIKNKVKEYNPKLILEVDEVYIKLNIKESAININTKRANLIAESNPIKISKIDINLNLLKFLSNENLIKNIKIKSSNNLLKDIASFLNVVDYNLPRYILFSQIKKGLLNFEYEAKFDNSSQDIISYLISGSVKNAKLNIPGYKNLDEINFNFLAKDKKVKFSNLNFIFQNIGFLSKSLEAKEDKSGSYNIEGDIENTKALINPNLLFKFTKIKQDFFSSKDILFQSKNTFSFKLNRNKKIKNLKINSVLNFDEIYFNDKYQNIFYLKRGIINSKFEDGQLVADLNSNFALFDNLNLNNNFKNNNLRLFLNTKNDQKFQINGNISNGKILIDPKNFLDLLNLDSKFLSDDKINIRSDNTFKFELNKGRIENYLVASEIYVDKFAFNKQIQDIFYLKNIKTKLIFGDKLLKIDLSSNYSFLDKNSNNESDKNVINFKLDKGDNKISDVELFVQSDNNYINIKEFKKYLNFQEHHSLIDDQIINLNSNLTINASIEDTLNIKKLAIKSDFNLDNLNINYKSDFFKKYLRNYDDKIDIKKPQIFFELSDDVINFQLDGKYLLNDKEDNIFIKFKGNKNNFEIYSLLSLDNCYLNFSEIEYLKKKNIPSTLEVLINNTDNVLKLEKIDYRENKNFFSVKNLFLSDNFKIRSLDKIDTNFLNNNGVRNTFKIIKNSNIYNLNGSQIDGEKIIESLLKTSNKNKVSNYFDNISTSLILNLDKIYLEKNEYLNKFKGELDIKNNKLILARADALLDKKKKFSYSYRTTNNDEKITNIVIDEPKPFINNYKFIKGFEEGELKLNSIKIDNVSRSNLKINNFKVKEVPVLAKILTLASLQGIADLLTGEGIRFDEFEMDFKNKNNFTEIEEMYALGPAISIMLEGYIEKDKLTSLRGTLVPATTINKTIAKIPLIGNILVGSKTGEGIFGVSFKIKGPPNNLKSTVNPIKTLTPRFITRTLENLKGN